MIYAMSQARDRRRMYYNECKELQIKDLEEKHYWGLGIFFGIFFAIFLSIAIATNHNVSPIGALIWIVGTWAVLVGVPIAIVEGIATHNCRPLLKYNNVVECEESCSYRACFNECIERARTEKDREWCDEYCMKAYQSCIDKCNKAFEVTTDIYQWHKFLKELFESNDS